MPRYPVNHAQRIRLVVVGPEHHLERRRDRGDDERRDQSRAESSDDDRSVRQRVGRPQHEDVQEKDEKERRGDRVRETDRRHDRREHGIEQADHQGSERVTPPRSALTRISLSLAHQSS